MVVRALERGLGADRDHDASLRTCAWAETRSWLRTAEYFKVERDRLDQEATPTNPRSQCAYVRPSLVLDTTLCRSTSTVHEGESSSPGSYDVPWPFYPLVLCPGCCVFLLWNWSSGNGVQCWHPIHISSGMNPSSRRWSTHPDHATPPHNKGRGDLLNTRTGSS